MTLKFVVVSMLIVAVSCNRCDYAVEDKSFRCQIRTLQSGLQNDDLDINKANKLKVLCSDLSFTESRVNAEHFGNLPFLEELDVEYCKVRQLPSRSFSGLSGLKRLSLQSHNSEWSSVLMEVDRHSLHSLTNMEELNWAHNNIWSLPNGVLCDLPKLHKVNFSSNHLMAASDLGLSGGGDCITAVKSLDLSHNYISTLTAIDLKQASELLQLNLAHNRINILGDDALVSLPSLQELNLSDNQLAALPPALFNQSQQLQRLHLQNNSLTLLPPMVFSGLTNLAVLNLSGNAISSHLLSEETFSGLTELRVLDLSYNHLTKIDTNTFRHLKLLQILNLQSNKVHIVSGAAFLQQTHLQILSLSHNALEEVKEDVFSGLTKSLTSLSLDHNRIAAISIGEETVSGLNDLALNDNLLPSVPQFVRLAKQLRTLDLGDNAIRAIDSRDLHGLVHLYGLRLAGNRLESIGNDTFAHSPNIHVLNLAHNSISSIESGALNSLQELRALRLDANKVEDLNGLVSSLGKLQWLNVSSNSLQWFDYAFISASLEWLDVSHNRLTELGNFYELSEFGIKAVDASHNKISRLHAKSFPASGMLHTIDLRGNEVREVEPFAFANQGGLKRVDLSGNKIEGLLPDSLRVHAQAGRPDFFLLGNSLKCDCNLDWLQDINVVAEEIKSLARVSDLDSLECILATATNELLPLVSVPKTDFLCEYKAHCSASQCMCCDFYACDCRFQCPEGCDCYHDRHWNSNVIQCSAKGHGHIPLLIPLDATEVLLDGNDFRHLDTQSFLGRGHIKQLHLNQSNIISLGNNTFSGLTNLEVLHLEDNNIGQIRGYEFSSLTSLRELYLHNNDLVYINEISFEQLGNLRVLRLDGNLLTVFPVWSLNSNPGLNELTLSRNTWSCECDFIQPFNSFLEKKAVVIRDYDVIQCVSDNAIDDQVGQQVRCGQQQQSSSLSSSSESTPTNSDFDLVPIVVPVAIVALVILVSGLLAVFAFRKVIKNWLYSNNSTTTTNSQIYAGAGSNSSSSTYTPNKLFDVYVSYSVKDGAFAEQTLAPTLESCSYKLCLHQRDFPPSASLFDTVSVAAESSARVVIVLSKAYLQSEWPHVRIPLRDTFGKLVLLLNEDLCEEDLLPHPELLEHLRTGASAVVRWGAPGFLNKLRFHLPEPAFLTFQRNVTLRQHQHRQQQQLPPKPSLQPQQQPSHYRSNLESLQYAPYTVYGAPRSDHTYHSIPDNHIYHTLEPSKAFMQQSNKAVLLNRDLEVVLRASAVEQPAASSTSSSSSLGSPLMFHHSHTHSTSSGAQLLPSKDEYIV